VKGGMVRPPLAAEMEEKGYFKWPPPPQKERSTNFKLVTQTILISVNVSDFFRFLVFY
jgi:hypothetical protein